MLSLLIVSFVPTTITYLYDYPKCMPVGVQVFWRMLVGFHVRGKEANKWVRGNLKLTYVQLYMDGQMKELLEYQNDKEMKEYHRKLGMILPGLWWNRIMPPRNCIHYYMLVHILIEPVSEFSIFIFSSGIVYQAFILDTKFLLFLPSLCLLIASNYWRSRTSPYAWVLWDSLWPKTTNHFSFLRSQIHDNGRNQTWRNGCAGQSASSHWREWRCISSTCEAKTFARWAKSPSWRGHRPSWATSCGNI